VPIYEYRCRDCGAVTGRLASIKEIPKEVACERCDGQALRIISRPSVKLSAKSKVGRLDPKYDRMVDQAMRNTSAADPDRLINRRGDIAKGRPD
jgi:putative FmdB family regulatory protein